MIELVDTIDDPSSPAEAVQAAAEKLDRFDSLLQRVTLAGGVCSMFFFYSFLFLVAGIHLFVLYAEVLVLFFLDPTTPPPNRLYLDTDMDRGSL